MLGKRNLRKDVFTLAHGFQRKHDYRSVVCLATRPECSGSQDRDTLTLHSHSLLRWFRAQGAELSTCRLGHPPLVKLVWKHS